jgi:DNA-binding Lrp family transcriptional regulator
MKRQKLDLKLIAELMKNSKQSDRELAKKLGVSQPTVTRTRTRLEKEGYIKEYTLIRARDGIYQGVKANSLV